MAANSGRTLSKYTTFWIDASNGTLTQLTSINNIGGLQLSADATELTAWADAIKGVLLGIPGFSTTIGGVFDTTDHAVLVGINNLNVPLAMDVRVGIRHPWETGEPHFGITGTAANGFLLHNYNVDLNNMTWSAVIEVAAGSAAPAWSTGAAYS